MSAEPGQRHRAGYATHPGDVTSMIGEAKGPTTFGSSVIAAGTKYEPDGDTTRVSFVYATDDDLRALAAAVPHGE